MRDEATAPSEPPAKLVERETMDEVETQSENLAVVAKELETHDEVENQSEPLLRRKKIHNSPIRYFMKL